MTIGLDTSVVLRLLTGTPTAEAATARARLERAVFDREKVIVTDLVLAEAYFALHHHYGVPKDEARATLRAMIASGIVAIGTSSLISTTTLPVTELPLASVAV